MLVLWDKWLTKERTISFLDAIKFQCKLEAAAVIIVQLELITELINNSSNSKEIVIKLNHVKEEITKTYNSSINQLLVRLLTPTLMKMNKATSRKVMMKRKLSTLKMLMTLMRATQVMKKRNITDSTFQDNSKELPTTGNHNDRPNSDKHQLTKTGKHLTIATTEDSNIQLIHRLSTFLSNSSQIVVAAKVVIQTSSLILELETSL